MSIPVVSTGLINAPYWVWRLFYSIDYPVEHFVVFNNNGRGQITKELDLLNSVPHPFIKKVSVCHLPGNIGCAGYWNLTIKSLPTALYWLLVNHDIMFTPGFLEALDKAAHDAETGIVHGDNGAWDVFAIKDWVVQKYGLFDENTAPAYCEDLDYGMRFKGRDLKRCMGVGVPYYHGSKSGSYEDGSQSWRSEPEIAQRIHMAHEMNKHYLHAKWSPAWQQHVDGDVYPTPFNNPALPIDFTTYDLEFIRKKHLGF